jgi:hypothetical protein
MRQDRIFFFFFFLYMFLANQQFISHNLFHLSPLTEVSPQLSAISGGNPPDNWQSAMGWGDAGFEPGTGQDRILSLGTQACRVVSTCRTEHALIVKGMLFELGVKDVDKILTFCDLQDRIEELPE